MKKVRILFRYLCIFVLLSMMSCQNDAPLEELGKDIELEPTYKVSVIYTQEIQANSKLDEKMRNLIPIRQNQIGKNVYNETYNFTIDTSAAKFIENTENNSHSYTLAISRDTDIGSTIENIVFSYDALNDNYTASLVTYLFTAAQKQEYLSFGYVSTPYDLQYEFVDVAWSDDFEKSVTPCTVTYTEFHQPQGSDDSFLYSVDGIVQNICLHENDDNPCYSYTVIEIYCPDGGSASTTHSTADNSTQNTDSSDSTSGGGSSSTDDSLDGGDSDENIVTSIISREENIQKSILDCINGISDFNTTDATTIDAAIFNQTNFDLNVWIALNDYLQDNGCSEASQEQVIEEILEEFDNLIFKDESFTNNPCLNSVYNEMGKASKFNTYLKNFESQFSVAHLRFSTSTSLDDEVNAVTSAPQNYLIKITFNLNNLDRPKLAIARTFMHEIIHAEIFRKLLSVAQHPSIQLTQNQVIQLRNDYPGLYDYYTRWKWNVPHGQEPSDAQHEAMAQHYRDIIIQALREYDNNMQTDEVYEALSWTGLKATVAWQNLSPTERANIDQTISNFYQNNPNCQ
ncbi:hypothetical protein C8N46_10290 [Kordia periserrulae]|uniref:Lipoprotein n=1 Tax=Kordia periserrulae TaxID=701523 RepID=A0A2T6C304_9FLAO|nr:hypothetical protein [Kordia periserrulae]PTX62694.1 hypothetical protein C8N46_10290 [Kordia periserrulae]